MLRSLLKLSTMRRWIVVTNRAMSSASHKNAFVKESNYEVNTKSIAATITQHFEAEQQEARQLAGLMALRFLNVATIDFKALDEKINLLKKHFHKEDIFHNAQIFFVSFEELELRISILQELGFENLKIRLLYSLQYLLSQNLESLKANHLYPEKGDPYSSLIKLIKQDSTLSKCCDKTNIFKRDSKLLKDINVLSLREMRARCFHAFLRDNILNSSDQVATHLVENLNTHRSLDKICLLNFLRSIHILVNHIHLPIHHLIRYFSYYVNCKADNLSRFASIKYFQNDYNFRVAFFSRQRLLNLNANVVKERLDHLVNNHKCTIKQISNCIFILEARIEEVDQLFKQFHSCEQLNIFADSDDLLRLVLNIQTAYNNLAKLNEKDISLKYIAVSDLLKSRAKFCNMVNSNNFKLNLNSFVQLHFSRSLKDIKNRIGNFKVPASSETLNSANAENIVNYFRLEGLSDEQIMNGIYLIYFNFNNIKTAWREMFARAEVGEEWRQHSHVLQLLFHHLEKCKEL